MISVAQETLFNEDGEKSETALAGKEPAKRP